MTDAEEGTRELLISTDKSGASGVLVAIADTGPDWIWGALNVCSKPFTRPNLADWGWDFPSAVRSSKLTAATVGVGELAPWRRLSVHSAGSRGHRRVRARSGGLKITCDEACREVSPLGRAAS